MGLNNFMLTTICAYKETWCPGTWDVSTWISVIGVFASVGAIIAALWISNKSSKENRENTNDKIEAIKNANSKQINNLENLAQKMSSQTDKIIKLVALLQMQIILYSIMNYYSMSKDRILNEKEHAQIDEEAKENIKQALDLINKYNSEQSKKDLNIELVINYRKQLAVMMKKIDSLNDKNKLLENKNTNWSNTQKLLFDVYGQCETLFNEIDSRSKNGVEGS